MTPGIYYNIPIDEYHSGPGISKSGLDLIARSPLHYIDRGQRKESPAFALGSAAHCAILEPEQFESRYFRGTAERRGTKAWEADVAAANGREVLKSDDWDTAWEIRKAVMSHDGVKILFLGPEKGIVEASAYWIDGETGELCKCRPDYWMNGPGFVVDLKTTQDASPAAFARSIAAYRYHVQAAFYSDGMGALGQHVNGWYFLAVEKDPPYACAVYSLAPAAIEEGRRLYRRDLRRYAECKRVNDWPGYPVFQELDLPVWAYKTKTGETDD